MPNNRGVVPMYNENPQYSATISSQLPQGSPAMFGTGVAKEMAGMGDAIGKWGTTLVESALKMQERDDNAFILEKDNEMRAAMTDLLYNPQNGLANTKGKNSFGVTQTYDEAVEKLTQDAMSGIGNPALQAKLQEHNMQWVNSLRTTIAKHEGGERFTYYSNNMNASSLSARNIGLQIGGVNGMQAGVAIIEGLRETGKSLLGWDDTMADNWIREQKSAIFDALVKDCIDRGDTAGQQALVDIFGGDVNGQSLLGAKSKLAVIQEQQDAVKMLDDAIKAHPDWIVDGVLDEAKVSEWIENNYGQNAPDRIERVLVGGGSNDRFVRIAQETAAIIRQKYPDASPNLEKYLYGQMMRETGWGKDPIALEYNNFAGLHGGAKGRKYADDHDYAKDYASFFTDGYHTQAIYATDGTDFARRLSNKLDGGSGWYEDRNYQGYGQTIMEAMADYDKKSAAGGVEPYQMPTQGANIDAQVGELKSGWAEQLPLIGGILHSMGMDGVISSAARSAEHNAEVGGSPTSHHINHGQGGDALDIVLPDGTTKADAEKVLAKFKETGAFDEVLFHDAGSGYHLHLGGLKGSLAGQGGSHYEERRVSGYNPVMRDAMMARAKQAVANYKSDNTRKFNSYRDMLRQLPEVQNARDISEFRVLYQRYGIPQYMWDSLTNAISTDMKMNLAHENRIEHDEDRAYTLERRAKARAKEQALDTISNKMFEIESSGGNITADDFLQMSGVAELRQSDPSTFYSMWSHIKKAEDSSDPYGGWYKGRNRQYFDAAVKDMRKKDDEFGYIAEANLMDKVTEENMRRKNANELPLDAEGIRDIVKDNMSDKNINRGWFTGTKVKRYNIPYGWTETPYGVLDDKGNTVEWKDGKWVLLHAAEPVDYDSYRDNPANMYGNPYR